MENINCNQFQLLNYYKKNRELYRKLGKRLERLKKKKLSIIQLLVELKLEKVFKKK